MLFTEDGVKFARAVMRLPDLLKFEVSSVQNVNVTPWELHSSSVVDVVVTRNQHEYMKLSNNRQCLP